MPNNVILSEPQYANLVREIRALIEEGRKRAVQSARQELVQTYWKIGKRISEEGLTQNAGYNQAILADLSEELDIDYTTLTRCIHFFQTYNVATSGKNLTWSHYRCLIPVNNEAERKWYADLVEADRLDAATLSRAIKENRYRESVKSGDEGQATRNLTRPTKATYVYKAVVDRVIDGDTLLLKIDLGFQVWQEQRVRLANIDTPAMDKPDGREAYRFVLGQLAKVNFVMVKTNKIDIYGRYVGHIFYSSRSLNKDETFSKGEYLNQELVQQGLAKIV
ncbi:MAG: thermonuclease family protein [Candidatus Omnitrophica bacterium]|nr:thermonuclease family protein [Candidatus Omnitrophota bacterium]